MHTLENLQKNKISLWWIGGTWCIDTYLKYEVVAIITGISFSWISFFRPQNLPTSHMVKFVEVPTITPPNILARYAGHFHPGLALPHPRAPPSFVRIHCCTHGGIMTGEAAHFTSEWGLTVRLMPRPLLAKARLSHCAAWCFHGVWWVLHTCIIIF